MHAVFTRRDASAASPFENSSDAMPLAMICSKIAAKRSICRRMMAQFSVIAASIKSQRQLHGFQADAAAKGQTR
jgi:hypothetical protein